MTFLKLFYEFFKIGLFAVGGGPATIPFLQDLARSDYGWFNEDQLGVMVAIAESTPGPIGVNMATYAGYNAGFGELGVVGGNEGDGAAHEILCTNPDDAKLFCDETGVDALAVAIGNAHGNYPVLPNLRFDVLDDINKMVDTPLVLHGGTGITDEMFQQAIMLGVRKVNIATASFDNLAKYALEYCKPIEKANYFELSRQEAIGVYENVKRHIKVFSFMER